MNRLLPLLLLALMGCSPAKKSEISVMTYNVHNAIGLDKVRDYQRIAEVISAVSPDVVALQELDSITMRNDSVFALDELAKRSNMEGIFASAISFQGGSYGIGMLSKEKPLNYRIVPMPGREEKRTMIVAEFKEYVFCCTHQSLTAEDQVASVKLITEALLDIEKPIILAGDMNSKPHELPQQLLREKFLTLSDTTACTFPADKPDRCIDYIYGFAKNGHRFEVIGQEVLKEELASDHRPVWARIVID